MVKYSGEDDRLNVLLHCMNGMDIYDKNFFEKNEKKGLTQRGDSVIIYIVLEEHNN